MRRHSLKRLNKETRERRHRHSLHLERNLYDIVNVTKSLPAAERVQYNRKPRYLTKLNFKSSIFRSSNEKEDDEGPSVFEGDKRFCEEDGFFVLNQPQSSWCEKNTIRRIFLPLLTAAKGNKKNDVRSSTTEAA